MKNHHVWIYLFLNQVIKIKWLFYILSKLRCKQDSASSQHASIVFLSSTLLISARWLHFRQRLTLRETLCSIFNWLYCGNVSPLVKETEGKITVHHGKAHNLHGGAKLGFIAGVMQTNRSLFYYMGLVLVRTIDSHCFHIRLYIFSKPILTICTDHLLIKLDI